MAGALTVNPEHLPMWGAIAVNALILLGHVVKTGGGISKYLLRIERRLYKIEVRLGIEERGLEE